MEDLKLGDWLCFKRWKVKGIAVAALMVLEAPETNQLTVLCGWFNANRDWKNAYFPISVLERAA